MAYRNCKKLNIYKDYKEIEEALEINNNIWNIKSTLSEFKSRAKNGYLIALFEDDILQGTISGITLNKSDILEDKRHYTWNGITENGTFDNINQNGDSLCCVAITSKFTSDNKDNIDDIISKTQNIPQKIQNWISMLNNGNYNEDSELVSFINQNIENYVSIDLDPVINFHKKSKIVIGGAKIIKIFYNGRICDNSSLGFNVLMEYPELTDELRNDLLNIDINCDGMSIGKALILGGLKEAIKNKNIRYILPYSRPAKYQYYLTRALYRCYNKLDFDSDAERVFYDTIEIH